MSTLKAKDRVRITRTGQMGYIAMVPSPEFKPDGKPTHYVTLDNGNMALVWPDQLIKIEESA